MFDLIWPGPVLVGLAALSVLASQPVLTSLFPWLESPNDEPLELGPFVLCDEVPASGDSEQMKNGGLP